MRRLILALLACAWPAVAAAQTATFLQNTDDTTDTTTYTFAAQNLGAAASDRYITVVSFGRKTGTATCNTLTPTVSVGGVSASWITSRDSSLSNCNFAAIHKALVPSGTTGDIVVTYPTTMLQAHIGVFQSTGVQTTAATDTAISSIADPQAQMDIPANGYAVGGSISAAGAGATVTWTGLTEQFDVPMVSGSASSVSGAMLTPGTTQTNLSIMADWAGTPTESAGVWASWALSPSAATTSHTPHFTVLGVGLEP